MDLAQIVAVALAAAGAGGAVGWWLHRSGEAARNDAHEAVCREMARAAGIARDRARREGEDLQQRLDLLRKEHAETTSDADVLRERLSKLRDSSDGRVERLEDLEEVASQLRGQLEASETRCASLQASLGQREAALKRTASELEAARSSLTSAKATAKQGDSEIGRLRGELARAAELHETVEGLERRLRERSGALQALEAELAHARDAHAGCADIRTSLELRIAELEQAIERHDQALAAGGPEWLLPAAQGDKKDDLQAIRGLGPVMERRLNALGIFHYRQLARITAADARWLGEHLQIPPRKIERDRWAWQAGRMQAGEGKEQAS